MLSRLLKVTIQRLHWYREVSTGPGAFELGRKFLGTGMPTSPPPATATALLPGEIWRLMGALLSGESPLLSASLSFPSDSRAEEAARIMWPCLVFRSRSLIMEPSGLSG